MINLLKYNQHCYQMLAALSGGGRLPHTVIISGKPGSGKKTFALHLAACYLCSNLCQDGLPCGECLNCRLILEQKHPDVEQVKPDKSSKIGAITIEQIRQLKTKSIIRPNQSDRRGFIIENSHLMRTSAQNALLKQTEEPSLGVFYILIADNAYSLLETIRSRAVIINMAELSPEQCCEVVCSVVPQTDKEIITTASYMCGGSVGMTIKSLNGDEKYFEDCKILLECIQSKNCYKFIVILSKYDSDRIKYTEILNALKLMIVARSRERSFALTLSQMVTMSDAINYSLLRCAQNTVIPLITGVLAEQLRIL